MKANKNSAERQDKRLKTGGDLGISLYHVQARMSLSFWMEAPFYTAIFVLYTIRYTKVCAKYNYKGGL